MTTKLAIRSWEAHITKAIDMWAQLRQKRLRIELLKISQHLQEIKTVDVVKEL